MAYLHAIEAFPSLWGPIPGSFSKQIDLRGNSNMKRLEDYTTEMNAVIGEAQESGETDRSSAAGRFRLASWRLAFSPARRRVAG